MTKTPKRGKKYMIELLWQEFEGEKEALILYELNWCKIITKKELEKAIWEKGGGDTYYFTLACFFLLYLEQEF